MGPTRSGAVGCGGDGIFFGKNPSPPFFSEKKLPTDERKPLYRLSPPKKNMPEKSGFYRLSFFFSEAKIPMKKSRSNNPMTSRLREKLLNNCKVHLLSSP